LCRSKSCVEDVALQVATQPARLTGLIGAAGEYYVAAELSRRGWLATVTIKNAPGTDVLAQRVHTGAVVAIQTKTASRGNNFWVDKKCEVPARAMNEWYVLVDLRADGDRPKFYVIPRNIIAGATYAQHVEWLQRPREGRSVKDTTQRSLHAKYLTGYEDRWDLLDRPADEAPLLIGEWYTECVRRFGLPPGHPGWPAA
jgi:hypothetical protein